MTSNENEFRLAIHNALCSCLGLPPSSEQALSLIRQAYTEPENNPQPARTAPEMIRLRITRQLLLPERISRRFTGIWRISC